MAVLLMRLCGPMQSWGTQSRFTNRDTGLEPSKSGVIGLVCAAMGIPRDDTASLKKLADLKMGVRVDREGVMKRDYHTAQNVIKASGQIPKEGEAVISYRFYLADACFLVALQGGTALLRKVNDALKNPVWQPFLGRKSFLPGLPVWLKDGLLPDNDDIEGALRTGYPYLCLERTWDEKEHRLRLEIEVPYGQGELIRNDQPISFSINHRQFGPRDVVTKWVGRSELPAPKEDELLCTFLA